MSLYLIVNFIDPCVDAGSSAAAVYQMECCDRTFDFCFQFVERLAYGFDQFIYRCFHKHYCSACCQIVADSHRSVVVAVHRVSDRCQIAESVFYCERVTYSI